MSCRHKLTNFVPGWRTKEVVPLAIKLRFSASRNYEICIPTTQLVYFIQILIYIICHMSELSPL